MAMSEEQKKKAAAKAAKAKAARSSKGGRKAKRAGRSVTPPSDKKGGLGGRKVKGRKRKTAISRTRVTKGGGFGGKP